MRLFLLFEIFHNNIYFILSSLILQEVSQSQFNQMLNRCQDRAFLSS